MLKYLGFTRSLVDPVTNQPKTETIYVPVEIPGLKSTDGWKLIGGCDTVSVLPTAAPDIHEQVATVEQLRIAGMESSNAANALPVGASFPSPVCGTARLVRTKAAVLIAYRKGNKHESSPNSVCISENMKMQFFDDCRAVYGKNCDIYKFTHPSDMYSLWSKKIDDEYMRQLREVNRTTFSA